MFYFSHIASSVIHTGRVVVQLRGLALIPIADKLAIEALAIATFARVMCGVYALVIGARLRRSVRAVSEPDLCIKVALLADIMRCFWLA